MKVYYIRAVFLLLLFLGATQNFSTGISHPESTWEKITWHITYDNGTVYYNHNKCNVSLQKCFNPVLVLNFTYVVNGTWWGLAHYGDNRHGNLVTWLMDNETNFWQVYIGNCKISGDQVTCTPILMLGQGSIPHTDKYLKYHLYVPSPGSST